MSNDLHTCMQLWRSNVTKIVTFVSDVQYCVIINLYQCMTSCMILHGRRTNCNFLTEELVLPTEKISSSSLSSVLWIRLRSTSALLQQFTKCQPCLSHQPKYKFSLSTKQNPDSAHPIVIIHFPLSPYRLCRPIYNELHQNRIHVWRLRSSGIWVWWWWSWLESTQEDAPILRIVYRLFMKASIVQYSTRSAGNLGRCLSIEALIDCTLKVLELDIRPMYWTPTDNTQLLEWRHLRRFTRATGTDLIGQPYPYILGGFAPEKFGLADVLDIYSSLLSSLLPPTMGLISLHTLSTSTLAIIGLFIRF